MRKLRIGLVGALLAATVIAAPASASAAPAPRDYECLQSGLSVLQANGGVQFFARNGVPVSLINPSSEAILPLNTVLRLHLTNPEIWPWC
jgi:hypothetical protein